MFYKKEDKITKKIISIPTVSQFNLYPYERIDSFRIDE